MDVSAAALTSCNPEIAARSSGFMPFYGRKGSIFMPGYLPPVVTRLTAEIGDFLDGMAKAAAAQDALRGSIKDTNTVLAEQAALFRTVNPAISSMTRRAGFAAAAQGRLKSAIEDTSGALYRHVAALAAVDAASGLLGGGGLGGGTLGGATRGGGFRYFGLPLNATTLHWLIAGGAEIAAVTVPALIALGAASAAAIEGITNLTQHMQSVYTATEATSRMFGVTFGDSIGLARGQLQRAQDAADPMIYGILGSAVKTVNEHFGNLAQTGTQVIGVMQTFGARVASDFAPGGVLGSSVDTLLAHMQSDLVGIGQVFGNLGNFVLAFGAQMPGLAELLLKGLSGATGLAAKLVDLSAQFRIGNFSVLTAVMGYEEFYRWGGLVLGLLDRLGIVSGGTRAAMGSALLPVQYLGNALRSLWSIIPNVIGGLGNLASKVGAKGLGTAMNDTADTIGMGISSLATWQLALVTAGAVGVGFLIDKLVTAQTAAQRLGAAMQQTVMSETNVNVTKVLAANMAVLNSQIQQATKSYNELTSGSDRSMEKGAGRGRGMVLAISQARTAVQQYNADLTQQQKDMANVQQGARWIARAFGTTMQGALILADNANVKLANGIMGTNHRLSVAQLQIMSLVQGYRAMGQSSGEVGADMTALAIQSGLAGTQVSKLNSAWDDLMGNMTGGTTGLGGFVNSLTNIGQVVASAKNNLEKGSINLTTTQFAKALTNFGTVGSQAWQNFGQVVGSTAPQLIDWLRTAGAMGAIQAPQFSRAVLGMVSSLSKFAAQSPAARAQLIDLAQQANPNIKTWAQLNDAIKNGNISIKDTAKAVEGATVKMGNMAQVAQNLGQVMNANLLSAMSNATIAASGVQAATQKYMHDIMNTGTAISQTSKDRSALLQDLKNLGYGAKQAAQFIQALQGQINNLHGKTVTLTTVMQTVGGSSLGYGYHHLPGYAMGTSGARSGWAWVGEAGPELVRFRGGETVIPSGVSRGYAGGTGDNMMVDAHFYLDGKLLYRSTQRHAVTRQRQTGTNGLATRRR